MDKRAKYIYNPTTDNFERFYPSFKTRLIKVGAILLISFIIGFILFMIAFFGLTTKSEEILIKENTLLRSKYDVLERRVDASLKVMSKIQNRDDNLYRVLLQMDPMSAGQRYAGIDYTKNNTAVGDLTDKELIQQLTQKVDILDHELYSQIKSFDMIREALGGREEQFDHIPAIFPLKLENISIAGGFGPRRDPLSRKRKFHAGLDFSVPEGEEVYATADGIIQSAGRKGGAGNCVEISHGYNYETIYAHLSEISVQQGDKVKRGDLIGKVGSTGTSSGNHLHYEVRFKKEAQNPVNYLFLDLTPEKYIEISQYAEDAGNIMD